MKKRVLVVERDESVLELIAYILKEENFEVVSSFTEDGVIEKILAENPDAILLDIISPSEDGTILCREIKANPATSHIPVIVLSTHFNIEKISMPCADEKISKPFDVSKLVELVSKQMPVS